VTPGILGSVMSRIGAKGNAFSFKKRDQDREIDSANLIGPLVKRTQEGVGSIVRGWKSPLGLGTKGSSKA
jgi:hypothetical protein